MTQPSPELRQWQKYVNLFERASRFVDTHTQTPQDAVILHPSDIEPNAQDTRKSYMITLGRIPLADNRDLLGEVSVMRGSSRRWIALGTSMYDGDEARDDYTEALTINLYTAAEQPRPFQRFGIRFYDEWGDYRNMTMVDPPPERGLVGDEVIASRMISRLSGTSTAEMRSLLAVVIKAASTKQQRFEQYPHFLPMPALSPNDEP
jgi:hypothetical protein